MDELKSGFIAIAGRPNMGKSTFINAALGRKIAIVSPKAQTTRSRILGICHHTKGQMIFLDTPGIHATGRNVLNRAMVQTAYESCREVDAVLYFIDAKQGILAEDREILANLPNGSAPIILVVNKVDLIDRKKLLPLLHSIPLGTGTETAKGGKRNQHFSDVVPMSALTGENLERLLEVVLDKLPVGPKYYPDASFSEQPDSFLAAEIIREKLFFYLQQEIPYAVAVRVEQMQPREGSDILDITAMILVHRESQKAIVIGRQGEMMKRVGRAARQELEKLLGTRIFLRLWVKVRKEWFENPGLLRDLGYPDEDVGKPSR
ncbi:MAG: GTPase Era [Magnetococcus sp. DMHC-6]